MQMGVVTELSSVLKSGGAHLETWWEGEEGRGRGGGEGTKYRRYITVHPNDIKMRKKSTATTMEWHVRCNAASVQG